ncbi:bacterioferritin-associated ferredoxin [Actinomadura sp. WMMB 499]|uniref:(2Fe-2S)-binding protein n=1 Tax=Actinomadura sp. WMMB 499 TaxID=1219491 RepID=UPI001C3F877C|nr:(2Fe-2S)-binding protein [Actinomadura sp. WMMB 499]
MKSTEGPNRMYVCICNAVTEDDVHGCMANGTCATVKDVKAACGMQAGCGSCTRRISTLVSEYRTASEFADAITGGPLPPVSVPEPAPAPDTVEPVTVEPGPAAPETFAATSFHGRSAASEPMMSEQVGRGSAPPTAA